MIEPPDPAAAPIAALIAAHAPADAAEEAAQREIAALLAAHDAPWRRDRFAPGHLTASAIVVDPARERALLVYHHKLQRWLQPGGHFEAHERDPAAVASRLRNAGALFIGSSSAEVLGDYGAGPNHTLPTGGSARFQAGLSVATFLRLRSWMRIDDTAAARELVADAMALAQIEGLAGHRASAARRLSPE